MTFIEAPTNFYLGSYYDPDEREMLDEVAYYDSRDLTTHTVILGMTGSGKTGLGITLLEEAILDNIPAIVIDPKGDITNLMLTFPDLHVEALIPWVNADDARRAGMSVEGFAQHIAKRWRDGLNEWNIRPERVDAFKRASRISIYTPGSDAGLPISILDSFKFPTGGWTGNEEFQREQISGMVTALLALIGKRATPLKDREHVLLSNIIEEAWKNGRSLTLEELIFEVKSPPFQMLGVFNIEQLFPEKDRFNLAIELNKILAAPSFQTWINGTPLDVEQLLYTDDPHPLPRVSIFYLAHLTEDQRAFAVTLLLENMLAWMRTLSGTSSLRAILYFDELFGYFPPAPYNPPTKEPLLRLLKQARAFGIGCVLTTQNPMDIDYKGLSNAGTWIIGRLQTKNDKQRILNGLQTISTVQNRLDSKRIGQLISGLSPRTFVVHNIHDKRSPTVIHSRWTMSYLRGPLTRAQIRMLMDQAIQPDATQQSPKANPVSPAFEAVEQPLTLPEIWTVQESEDVYATATDMPIELFLETEPISTTAISQHIPSELETVSANASLDHIYTSSQDYTLQMPILPSTVDQFFLPVRLSLSEAIRKYEPQNVLPLDIDKYQAQLVYYPSFFAQIAMRYFDRKLDINALQHLAFQIFKVEPAGMIHWEDHQITPIELRLIHQEPNSGAVFKTLSASGLTNSARLHELRDGVLDYATRTAMLALYRNEALSLYSQPGESQHDFLLRTLQLAREARDLEIDQTITQYDNDIEILNKQVSQKIRQITTDKKVLAQHKRERLYTMGEAAIDLFRGRTSYTLSRISRAQRFKQQAQRRASSGDHDLTALENKLDTKQLELQNTLASVNKKWHEIANIATPFYLKPLKKNVVMELYGIGWIPHWSLILNSQLIIIPA